MPTFSILIPVYNSEKYLQKCINSILMQTFQDFEIILVNDGSTDKSGQMCDELAAQNHCIKIIHQQNQGPLIARITAFNAASGEFILYMDSDDSWDSQLLSYIYDAFNDFQCDIVSFKWKHINYDNNITKEAPPTYPKANIIYNIETLIAKFLTDEVENSLCTRAVKRAKINNKQISNLSALKDLRIGEDMIQSFIMIKDCKTMVYLDKALYFYRENTKSLTHQSSIQKSTKDVAIAREHLRRLLKISKFNQPKYQRMLEKNFLEHYLTDLVVLSSTNNIAMLKNISAEIRQMKIYKNAVHWIDQKQLSIKRRLLYNLEKRNWWRCFWMISRIYTKLNA